MTWDRNDLQRQQQGARRKRQTPQASFRAPSSLTHVPDPPSLTGAMPTLEADALFGMRADDETRWDLQAERELADMGFVAPRHWTRIRTWMFRGLSEL